MQLHVISTGKQPLTEFSDAAARIAPYVSFFHLRERGATANELLQGCHGLIKYGVSPDRIIVNDRVDVACAAGIKGVQLPYHSLPVAVVKQCFPQLVVGKSVHSLEEALQAEREGSDYVLYGHLYSTHSKPNIPPGGIEGLKKIVRSLHIPVIAIGGIQPQHVHEISRAGAAGIAVMSGILAAECSLTAALAYVEAIKALNTMNTL